MTGATGNMGFAGFKELFARRDRFNIRLLARKSEKNQKLLENYLNDGAVEVIWGDMMCFDDVLKGVTGADYVLHIGGMVSPAADYYPEKVNYYVYDSAPEYKIISSYNEIKKVYTDGH